MQNLYNLLDERWIPASRLDGGIEEFSLRDFLLHAHELREIAHPSPLFEIAMLTLCVALLQSAWEGDSTIEREDEWERIWNLGQFENEFLESYFEEWHPRFNLFDSQFPFYQTANLSMAEASQLSRLAMEEQNTPTMFANTANPDWSAPPPSLAAQLLLSIQVSALGFGKASKAKIGKEEIEPPYSADGPLLRGLTIWPSGSNLFETLMLCTVPQEHSDEDKPCWELDEPYKLRDVLTSAGRKTEPIRGICDLLTLQSRLIRLLPEERDGKTVVPSVYFTQGRSLDKGSGVSFHPFKLYVPSKLTGFAPLALSEHKAIWRNSAALLSSENRNRNEFSPLAFVAQMVEGHVLKPDFRAGLDVVGMATDPGKAGKFLLWRHDRLPLPPALLTDPNVESRVEEAIGEADKLAEEMRQRFVIVVRALVMPERLAGLSANPDDVNALVAKFDPRRAFWPVLENHFLAYLKGLAEDHEAARLQWRRDIEATANDCFRASCNALGNGPRAVVAVAQVFDTFSVANINNRSNRPVAAA